MRGWGIFCLILGVGSFVLPRFGMQFMLIGIFGKAAPLVGGILALLGVILIGLSFATGRGKAE